MVCVYWYFECAYLNRIGDSKQRNKSRKDVLGEVVVGSFFGN